jgi:type I restriction enzyme S subunit
MNRIVIKLGGHSFVTKLAGFEHSKYIQHNATHEINEIPLIQGKNIKDGKVINSFDWYISKAISDVLPRSVLNKKCIVIPYVGSRLGELAIFENNFRCHLASNVAKVELTDNVIDLKYLYYYLKSSYGQSQLFKDKQGSAQPNITMEAIRETKVVVFDILTQQKIASVLSALDSKIELNKRINAELEAMAKTLYDYWFVQFDFPFDFAQGKPNANGKPYKSSGGKMVWNEELKREIPDGWEVNFLGDLGNFKNGVNYDPSNPGEIACPIINVRNISASSYFLKNEDLDVIYLKKSDVRKYAVHEGSIIIARSGIPGATRLISDIAENTLYCGFAIHYELKNLKNKIPIFFYLKSIEQRIQNGSGGTILKNVNQGTLNALQFALPIENSIISKFNELIQPIFSKINLIQRENQKLTELRDWLLPMLMNGQVKVDLEE